MQEYRYRQYQNYRLLDELDQLLFVYEYSSLATSNPSVTTYLPLWRNVDYLVTRFSRVTGYQWTRRANYLPHRWVRANATVQLFNRIVEDRIDLNRMRTYDQTWSTIASTYENYRGSLEANSSCDFAHLQLKFIEFLSSIEGTRFLEGNGSPEHPGIRHVLVDEYQDTNPIQETIYLELARRPPHNLCVVGDDDQTLYPFRGGTVDCMVNFDRACQSAWGAGVGVMRLPLSTNYRSHPELVRWCDGYIQSFATMGIPGARVANKPTLLADPAWLPRRISNRTVLGTYPVVAHLLGRNSDDLPNRFATLVQGLLQNGIVQDPNWCVLLLKSTRDNVSGPYRDALEARGIQGYNPRSKTFLEQPEIQAALGGLTTILDPDATALAQIRGAAGIQRMLNGWRRAYDAASANNPTLTDYVQRAIARIRTVSAGRMVTQLATTETTFRRGVAWEAPHVRPPNGWKISRVPGVEKWGLDGAEAQNAHADAIVCRFTAQARREANDGVLRGRVGHGKRGGSQTAARSHVDNVA
jgi:DNA helicase-2/ATP-dependent DNA helicase PcrA